MQIKTVIQQIGGRVETYKRTPDILASGRVADEIATLCREFLPSGSGFNDGSSLDLDSSSARRLVFKTAFHHMDDNGHYDGWTHHNVIAIPEFDGFSLRVTGRDRNGIKDYIGDTFHHMLGVLVESKWSHDRQICEFIAHSI